MPDAPARTGGDGRFDLTGLAPGTIQLEVTHDDYLPATTNAIDAPPGATVSDVRVVLRAGGTIRGIVRTAEGNPDGAAVIQASSGPIGSPLIRSAATDAQGRYAIRGLGAGSWTIRAQKREGQYAVSEEDRGLKPPRVVTITGEAVIDADF